MQLLDYKNFISYSNFIVFVFFLSVSMGCSCHFLIILVSRLQPFNPCTFISHPVIDQFVNIELFLHDLGVRVEVTCLFLLLRSHLSDYMLINFQIICTVKKHILTGGPKRLPFTVPPLIFCALKVNHPFSL